ncbi:hypothetical protein Zmor_005816 [Zophobas morio]|uniref:Uncharacterized protein n=1 Tax=Zophobas morio TaxID=2755281 RepID=A0AA38IW44_9CUCU|nr:hypothetical protein Zmor_005816 [Zophobas morio]
MLICGKSGKAISNVIINNCDEISDLTSKNSQLLFTCINDRSITTMKIAFALMKKRYNNASLPILPIKTQNPPDDENTYTVENRKLTVNNGGVCPDCHATVDLAEVNAKKKKTWQFNNAYIMNPKVFHFQATQSNLDLFKGHINGFILKIWQWPATNVASKRNSNYKSVKRSIFSKNTTYVPNVISERVVLITFNSTNVHVINASLTEINQLCLPSDKEYVCQPDLRSQENSILVGDLDQDGSQELISYSSGFVKKEDSEEWSLVSNIKVIRLEAELPKLYEEK